MSSATHNLIPTESVLILKMEHGVNTEVIKLIFLEGTAYVWNADDWMKLRSWRILGNFIGSLAALPRQGQFAGLPLALLKEETSLLLEKNLAVLKSIPNISNPPDEDIKKESEKYFEKLFSEQTELLKNKRKKELELKIDIILEGKKAKRRKVETEHLDKESVLEEEINKIQPIKKSALAIQICTDDPWLRDENYEDFPWDYPRDQGERLNYSVFKDLWEKGYYITPGGKFGGDYLAYPGDPVKFHAFFIVICLEKEKAIGMNEIISYGRLGQSVRKTVLLAFLDENKVCYQSIQWTGF